LTRPATKQHKSLACTKVPERSGPGPAEPSSRVWHYHSHVDETADTNAGLFGMIIISRSGPTTAPPDTGSALAEAFFVFSVIDERSSRYFLDNVKR
jgi:manganese oxidase